MVYSNPPRPILNFFAATLLTAVTHAALGAPSIQQTTGTLDHGGSVTIQGSGFGTKPTAAPLAWDDASGNNIRDIWDGAWPFQLPGYNIGYYDHLHGVSPPHSHDSHYIAGAHAGSKSAYAGYDVVFFKNISLRPFPFYIYSSWYQLADKGWIFGGDNNFKTFAYSNCCSPYEMPNNWFLAYGPPHPGSTNPSDTPQWLYTDDGDSLTLPDNNGHIAWWGHGKNPMAGVWAKVEVAVKVTNQHDGYIKVWEDGKQVMDYSGPTDKYPGNRRTIGIGGYARIQVPQNWRYFADAYLDTTLSRVVLADTPKLSDATIIENQIPTAWTDGSITATVNLGRFSQGEQAYLFVVDATGTPSATGTPVSAGGVADTTANSATAKPSAPSGVAVK